MKALNSDMGGGDAQAGSQIIVVFNFVLQHISVESFFIISMYSINIQTVRSIRHKFVLTVKL